MYELQLYTVILINKGVHDGLMVSVLSMLRSGSNPKKGTTSLLHLVNSIVQSTWSTMSTLTMCCL